MLGKMLTALKLSGSVVGLSLFNKGTTLDVFRFLGYSAVSIQVLTKLSNVGAMGFMIF